MTAISLDNQFLTKLSMYFSKSLFTFLITALDNESMFDIKYGIKSTETFDQELYLQAL